MAASYGREEADSPLRAHQHQHALAGRGVPESSQEIMHDTQVCSMSSLPPSPRELGTGVYQVIWCLH